MGLHELIGGSLAIFLGVLGILFFKRISQGTTDFQKKMVGINIDVKKMEIVFLLTGFAFVLIGAYVLIFMK